MRTDKIIMLSIADRNKIRYNISMKTKTARINRGGENKMTKEKWTVQVKHSRIAIPTETEFASREEAVIFANGKRGFARVRWVDIIAGGKQYIK